MAIETKLLGRVLVVDDHPLAREGLSLAARAAMPGVSVTEAGSAKEALGAIRRGEWRMILLDLELPDAHGLSALVTLQAHAPQASIVVVTASEKPSSIGTARAFGAAGYLFKSFALDDIVMKLRLVDRGQAAFPETASTLAIAELKARIDTLSTAQLNVLVALADGRSNKEIARELEVTDATIKAHLSAVFRKLNVANRTQALLAIRPIMGR